MDRLDAPPQNNPYQPPQATVADVSTGVELASRWTRLFAAILDTLILMVIFIPLGIALGFFAGFPIARPAFGSQILHSAVGLVLFLLLHGWFLHKYAQTIGKRLLKIRIVRTDGSQPDIGRLFALRILPVQIAAIIPVVGPFLAVLDCLSIFGKSRRCVHDYIADTRVVKVSV